MRRVRIVNSVNCIWDMQYSGAFIARNALISRNIPITLEICKLLKAKASVANSFSTTPQAVYRSARRCYWDEGHQIVSAQSSPSRSLAAKIAAQMRLQQTARKPPATTCGPWGGRWNPNAGEPVKKSEIRCKLMTQPEQSKYIILDKVYVNRKNSRGDMQEPGLDVSNMPFEHLGNPTRRMCGEGTGLLWSTAHCLQTSCLRIHNLQKVQSSISLHQRFIRMADKNVRRKFVAYE